jgi:hypothetical protein
MIWPASGTFVEIKLHVLCHVTYINYLEPLKPFRVSAITDSGQPATTAPMPKPLFLTRPLDSPHQSLLYLFIAYKSLVLLIALFSPGPGYDTSASLLTLPVNDGSSLTTFFELVAEKLTSWDAIYFTTVARRGYLYEQEWAFAWGWTKLISFFSSGRPLSIYIPIYELTPHRSRPDLPRIPPT